MVKKSTSRKPERDPEAMTGADFARARDALGLSQTQMAERLGVGLRTVVRMEASDARARDIPLTHAKHVRCIAREQRVKLK